MSRKGFRCFECDAAAKHAHHIVPLVLGGKRTIPLCEECHSKVHEQDFTNHSELTRIGVQKAREAGGNHGRPVIEVDFKKVTKLRKRGLKYSEIAKVLGIGTTTLFKRKGRDENSEDV